MTYWHRAGVSPYTSSCDLAETCVFSKQSPRPFLCGLLQLPEQVRSPTRRHSFSRSYGAILPSSLTGVLSRTLGFSPRLPVSVCGTDTRETHIEVFLGSLLKISWLARRLVSPSPLGVVITRIFPGDPPTGLDPHFQSRADRHFCVTP